VPSEPDVEREKRVAAEAAAELVEDGMAVGLGDGLHGRVSARPLAARGLGIRCVATSPATDAPRALGLGRVVRPLDELEIAIDGADRVTPTVGWSRAAVRLFRRRSSRRGAAIRGHRRLR
jgi:ribose 5-phosphate isomerase A